MSFKVVRLTVGKGLTSADVKDQKWTRQYFELEAEIQSEHDIESAKNSMEALIDLWLKGESIYKPQPQMRKQEVKKTEKSWSWNPDAIAWVQTKGTRGDYDRYPAENQKIEASPDYKTLLEDLKTHNNFIVRDGYNYWLFVDLVTVGRKPRSAKEHD
jgi:hypothetical protein